MFIPGFYIDISKNSNILKELEKLYDDKEKIALIDEIDKNCKNILKFIFNEKIFKLDIMLSWGKYYLELKKENNTFIKINEFINEFIHELLQLPNITTFSKNNYSNNLITKSTLYYINIIFEFFTFYKFEYDKKLLEKVGNKNNINLIKEISTNLKYILYNKREKGEGINPINYLENYEKKIDDYSFLNIAFSMFSPIWNQNLFI